jgi:hypothetical protein
VGLCATIHSLPSLAFALDQRLCFQPRVAHISRRLVSGCVRPSACRARIAPSAGVPSYGPSCCALLALRVPSARLIRRWTWLIIYPTAAESRGFWAGAARGRRLPGPRAARPKAARTASALSGKNAVVRLGKRPKTGLAPHTRFPAPSLAHKKDTVDTRDTADTLYFRRPALLSLRPAQPVDTRDTAGTTDTLSLRRQVFA